MEGAGRAGLGERRNCIRGSEPRASFRCWRSSQGPASCSAPGPSPGTPLGTNTPLGASTAALLPEIPALHPQGLPSSGVRRVESAASVPPSIFGRSLRLTAPVWEEALGSNPEALVHRLKSPSRRFMSLSPSVLRLKAGTMTILCVG